MARKITIKRRKKENQENKKDLPKQVVVTPTLFSVEEVQKELTDTKLQLTPLTNLEKLTNDLNKIIKRNTDLTYIKQLQIPKKEKNSLLFSIYEEGSKLLANLNVVHKYTVLRTLDNLLPNCNYPLEKTLDSLVELEQNSHFFNPNEISIAKNTLSTAIKILAKNAGYNLDTEFAATLSPIDNSTKTLKILDIYNSSSLFERKKIATIRYLAECNYFFWIGQDSKKIKVNFNEINTDNMHLIKTVKTRLIEALEKANIFDIPNNIIVKLTMYSCQIKKKKTKKQKKKFLPSLNDVWSDHIQEILLSRIDKIIIPLNELLQFLNKEVLCETMVKGRSKTPYTKESVIRDQTRQTLRNIYKDNFCKNIDEAIKAEDNVQHSPQEYQEYQDKNSSQGKLLEFIYVFYKLIMQKIGISPKLTKDTLGEYLERSREIENTRYGNSKAFIDMFSNIMKKTYKNSTD